VARRFNAVWMLTCSPLVLSPVMSVRAADALASGNAHELRTVVIEATAIPGTAVDADKIPGNVQSVTAADLARDGSANLSGAMDARLGSVNINDTLDDPFQPDILFRGFEASPVLGTPQGLAVYQNGVRINESFGDTVNWDLFPAIAINRVDLVSSGPVYGLNALGGGISISMKDGFSLVFTGPQTNINRLNFLTLNGSLKLTDTWSLQTLMYYRQFQQVVSNGNTTDYTSCTTSATAGELCQSDGATPVTNSAGAPLPDISDGGALYIGENDFETIN